MGFGLDDEIGQVRYDLAVEAVSGTEVSLAEGGMGHAAVPLGRRCRRRPALIRADRTQIGTLASRSAIVPLSGCIDSAGIDTSQFVESAPAQVTFEGEIYGIPEFNTVQLTMANADLLEEAGLTIEDVNGSDREALTQASAALHTASAPRSR